MALGVRMEKVAKSKALVSHTTALLIKETRLACRRLNTAQIIAS